jgi:aryl-alcohol dehydrogenase-like predicted oxidoreductase
VDRLGKYSGGASRLDTVIGLQIEYSLMERRVEWELIPVARFDLEVLAWSPLANDVLTWKYHGEGKADGARMFQRGNEGVPSRGTAGAADLSAVKSVSEQVGRSMAQVALA